MRELIDRLNDTTTHLDLGLDGLGTQHSDNTEVQAEWTYYASSKFAFLYHLIDSLRYHDCCIVIMARESRTMDLLENYLKANKVNYRRPPEFDSSESYRPEGSEGTLRIILLATGANLAREMSRRPALIIAFDISFNPQDPQVSRIRRQFSDHKELVPIVYLLVTNSAEHIDRCIPQSMPSPQRFQLLVQTTFRARQGLGGGPIMITSPTSQGQSGRIHVFAELKKSLEKRIKYPAEAVATAVLGDDFDADWLIPPIDELELDSFDEESPEPASTDSPASRSRAVTPSAQKRLRVSF